MKKFKEFINNKNDNVFPCYVHGKHSDHSLYEEKLKFSYRYLKNYHENLPDEEKYTFLHRELHDNQKMLTPEQSDAILNYTKSSTDINSSLIKNHKKDTPIPDNLTDDINHLDNLTKNHELHRPITTYSGLGFDPRNHINEKGIMYSPAFMSSSINPVTADSFAKALDEKGTRKYDIEGSYRHMVKIRHNKGDPGYYLGDHSKLDHEKEFLIPRGVDIHFEQNPEKIETQHDGTLHIWNATINHKR